MQQHAIPAGWKQFFHSPWHLDWIWDSSSLLFSW